MCRHCCLKSFEKNVSSIIDKIKEMCERITSSESYAEALSIIDEYVEITSIDDEQTEDEDFEMEMM